MVLFAGFLVLAFAAYLNVTPSAAIDGTQSAATTGLSAWNPNVTCAADLVTIKDVLGSAYPHQALSGSRYQHNATSGGIPLERSLSPPCTITNTTGAVLSSFVQINGVSLYGYGIKTTDCSGWYSKQNGGHRYPGNQTFCTDAGQIITLGTTSGYMKIEIDRDWLGKGYCGPNVPSCNNATLGQEQSNGSISLDMQGFVFWEGPYHWELHPLTAWKLSNSPPPPPPNAPPSAPRNLAATGGNAQVALTWQAPASDGGSPITNYKIYRGVAPSSETLLTTVGNVLTYTDSGVTNGATYYYQVSAVNSPGEGAKSNEASATPSAPPPPPSPPAAPTNLVGTAGNAQVGLTWQAPASNGGSPITNYKIYRGTSSNGETLKATIGNVLTYTDTTVTNGMTYYYQVSAVNGAGEGPRSNEASATPNAPPPPPSPPSAPTNLAATGGNAQVTLTWQAPASNGGSPITNYRIYRGTSSNSETLLATIGNQLSYLDGGLTNGVTYYYQVSAVNSVGEGPRSNEASATPTAPATPPGAPQGLVATAGDATVTLTWSAPSSSGGSPITNYRIYRGTSSNGETLLATIGIVLTYTDTSVTNGVTYYYQVSAMNAAGEGPRSNEASVTPSPPPPPNAPPTVDFTWTPTSGDTTTVFTFTAIANDDHDPPNTIQVRWDWTGDGTWDTSWSTTKTATLTFSSAGTYTVVVQAVDSGGLTATQSHTIVVTAPPPPADFSISASPASLTIVCGSSGSSGITLTSLNGLSGTASLSAAIASSGLVLVWPTVSLSPSSVTLPSGGTAASTLTVSTSVLTTPGTYTVTVTATIGSITHSATVTVVVTLM